MAEGTPFTITNCNIISLDKEAKIDKKNKSYLLFKFTVDHPKVQGIEFAKFSFTNKPDDWPRVGKIISMTGKRTQTGEYTNYTVDKITYDPASQPPPVGDDIFGEAPSTASSGAPSETIPLKSETIPRNNETIGKEPSVCASYAMELMKGLLMQGLSPKDADEALPIVCDSVARNGYILYATLKATMEKERAIK